MNDYRIGMSVAAAALLAVGCGTVKEPACVQFCESEITVACYYFGQYHPNDPRNLKERGWPWDEWKLIKAA
jgi:hypothetical protein